MLLMIGTTVITTLALVEALAKLELPACVAVKAQVPAPTRVRVLPDTVQMVPALLVLKVKLVRPLVELAVSGMDAAPRLTGDDGAKVTV
jgi:hypothetical protein